MKINLLIVQEETGSTQHNWELPEAGGVIGRSDSQIRLDDPLCSRQHALLYKDSQGRLRIRDLLSRNGTFVGGERVVDELVPEGTEVRVGSTRLIFQVVSFPRRVSERLIERNEYDR